MKLLKTFYVFLSLVIFHNVSNGQIIELKNNVNLRALPSINSEKLGVISSQSIINIENCNNGWCYVTYYGNVGYIKESIIKSHWNNNTYQYIHKKKTLNKHYTNSKGVQVQSPTFYNLMPSGATAICNDGTYSFSQSRRGTCSHHGGVMKWL